MAGVGKAGWRVVGQKCSCQPDHLSFYAIIRILAFILSKIGS